MSKKEYEVWNVGALSVRAAKCDIEAMKAVGRVPYFENGTLRIPPGVVLTRGISVRPLPSLEGAEVVRTAALANNAADLGRSVKDRQPQQCDRRVLEITADATGTERDRHGQRFYVAEEPSRGMRR